MHLGMCCDTDREAAGGCHVGQQIECVPVIACLSGAVGRQVAAEGEDILDAHAAVVNEQCSNVSTGVPNTREVRHRLDVGLCAHPPDDVSGSMTVRPTCAIGDADEVRSQRREFGNSSAERHLGAR
jgi:hypothetical protein